MHFETLKKPADFKRVRGGGRQATPWFILEGRARQVADVAGKPGVGCPRFGFTITRKVGGAVIRNRIRRRLKEALRQLEPGAARPDHDYVVVASRAAHDYPFAELSDALRAALRRIDRPAAGGRGGRDKGRATGGPQSGAAAGRGKRDDSVTRAEDTASPGDKGGAAPGHSGAGATPAAGANSSPAGPAGVRRHRGAGANTKG
ncbi:MAG: ribonuclease P protein component [Hyphomicrobiaceae bacterium]|nr:ribonuclease P protein component [Hyphomicrobiaceae bacterium]